MKTKHYYLLLAIFLNSCSNSFDQTDFEKDLSTSLNEVETSYMEIYKKHETIYKNGDNKIETDDSIRPLFDNQSKASTDVLDNLVGVIMEKGGNCGKYTKIDIYMDCEDDKNNNSSSGWIGATQQGANVNFSICAVPRELFSRSKIGTYALFTLSQFHEIPNDPAEYIIRHFSNEKSNNKNNMFINGVEIGKPGYREWVRYNIHQSRQSYFTHIYFTLFTQKPDGMTTFPDIGIPYGVLGTLAGHPNGYVYADDEDEGNNSYLDYSPDDYHWVQILYPVNSTEAKRFATVLTADRRDGGLGANKGTTLYMSKVR